MPRLGGNKCPLITIFQKNDFNIETIRLIHTCEN